MRTRRRSAGAFTTCSSPQLRPCTFATPGRARSASRSVMRIPVWRNAAAPLASERGPWSLMKKLRDIPMEMRSSYTSVFMTAARDVIDTTDAAPNTMPDSVRSERNLCPRISRNASPISSSQSRIAQRLDGREPRRAHRREHAGDQSYAHRGRQRNDRDERTHHRRHLHDVGDEARERGTQAESQQTADQRDDQDLGEHVREDPARRRAEGHAGAEFAHALDDRGEQDVRDHDATGHEGDDPDDQEDEVEEQEKLAGLLPGALAGRADVEVLAALPRKHHTAHLLLPALPAHARPPFE